jgi:hypothetical protein
MMLKQSLDKNRQTWLSEYANLANFLPLAWWDPTQKKPDSC